MNLRLKKVIAIMLVIAGLTVVFEDSFLGGVLIICSGLMLIPFIIERLSKEITFLQKRVPRRISILCLLSLGLILSGGLKSGSRDTKSQYENFIVNHIKNDSTDQSILFVRELGKIGGLFGNGNYSTIHPNDGYLEMNYDTVKKNMYVEFNSKLYLDSSEEYIKNGDKVKNIIIKYLIDDKFVIKERVTVFEYHDKPDVKYIGQDIPNVNEILSLDVIKLKEQELAARKQNEIELKLYEQRKKDFEESCFYPFSGAHIKLEEVIIQNMKDPDSYEHMETSFKLFKDYAIVKTRYRGRNSFGALVLNETNAKVFEKDCEIIEILD